MRVTYIDHSGFRLETETAYFLFDYYRGEIPAMKPEKPLYVFASHFHQDHFAPAVLALRKDMPCPAVPPVFLFGYDILAHRLVKEPGKNVHFLKAFETWEDERIFVKTLRSNDSGVAFCVTVKAEPREGELHLYHAGDLNNWHWDEDRESLILEKAYRAELRRIKGRRFDVAFLPLDPRLAEHAFDGIRDFFAYADAGTVFPMHMWDDYAVIDRFLTDPASAACRDRIMRITAPGQTFAGI